MKPLKTISVKFEQTISVELTEADIIALYSMLNRTPILKVTAIKYIRARFNLELKPAKEVVDYLCCKGQWLLD